MDEKTKALAERTVAAINAALADVEHLYGCREGIGLVIVRDEWELLIQTAEFERLSRLSEEAMRSHQ